MLGNRRFGGTVVPLILFVALAVGLGCRKELPELFDRNQPPETYITSAPVESLFDGFKVHLSWFGRDPDGEVAYYLWSWTDSSRAWFAAWNPETNPLDRILHGPEFAFDETHLTERTDTVFILPANDNGGTSRDLTFNVTAVDDKGRRDPVPARRYFTASVDKRPNIIWLDLPPDTLDSGEPFSVRFTGETENEELLGFQWSSGSQPGFFPKNENGDAVWTYQLPAGDPLKDATEVTLNYANDVGGLEPEIATFYRRGIFPIKVKCVDVAGVESDVNPDPANLRGVILPVLNRDPDTRLRPQDGDRYPIVVTYHDVDDIEQVIELDVTAVDSGIAGFYYSINDTLPWGEDVQVEFNFQGWDVDNPIVVDDSEIVPRFQMDYVWSTLSLANINIQTNGGSGPRYPASDDTAGIGFPEVLDDLSFPHWGAAGKHFKMNLLPVEYTVRGFVIDHFGRVDGTPCTIQLSAGFPSVVDSVVLSSFNATSILPNNPYNRVKIYPPLPGGISPIVKLAPNLVVEETWKRFVWIPGQSTAWVRPDSIETIAGVGVKCRYDVMLTVYGKDDVRNGSARQLGRILWDLQDSDPEFANSVNQFNANFSIQQGGFVKSWWGVSPGVPVVEGSYNIRLQVREFYSNINEASDAIYADHPDSMPHYLGDKLFQARFTNTRSTDLHIEKIENFEVRSKSLNTIGRMSDVVEGMFSIKFDPGPAVFPPPGP